ncbi:hypothetical protein CAC42_6134 [Sphaceloma murrayae]|uniref:tRNA wybutosine-synthesizing protein 4 n=1 Tax=Sphaceloma murrayae TaxID=2082308 RepID=A0A2K1QTB4_9PEZI|nr:hypothetical protein CAC42_6134 [Sphaceloma murrayae]
MSEKDPTQATHRKRPSKPTKMGAMGLPVTSNGDEYIMDTNNSSIVSMRSVEKLYYPNQPEYLRYFVRKFQRRSPLINRGYWLRMKAVETYVSDFLSESNGNTKVVVNLGCGYDPIALQFLGLRSEQCENTVFVDVDHPRLIHKKLDIIRNTPPLIDLLPGVRFGEQGATVLADASQYKGVGCDVRDIHALDRVLRTLVDVETCSVALLLTAEVSVAHMEQPAAQEILEWAARLPDARFCLLEQHLPDGADHPFAATMLKHFRKLRTPLHAIGTLNDTRRRFEAAGWPSGGVDIQTLWQVWSNEHFVTSVERQALDKVEAFDEWEEFALFGSHYFLLQASNQSKETVGSTEDRGDTSKSGAREESHLQLSPRNFEASAIPGLYEDRRFAAATIVPYNCLAGVEKRVVVGHWGGMGHQQRHKSADAYNSDIATSGNEAPLRRLIELPSGLVGHTITTCTLPEPSLVLIGGRGAPDKATDACWRLTDGLWKPTHSLPRDRFRHCAMEITSCPSLETASTTVLVFGGKTSTGDILNDWLLLDPVNGWVSCQMSGEHPEPRFGAASSVDASGASGMILGGMRSDGTVIEDAWSWRLDISRAGLTIHCANLFSESASDERRSLYRFGAQIVQHGAETLLVGGIASRGMLDRSNEIMSLTNLMGLRVTWIQRPLLIGFSTLSCKDGLLLLGGGAICFSFGAYWNKNQHIKETGKNTASWRALDLSAASPEQSCGSVSRGTEANLHDGIGKEPVNIGRSKIPRPVDFYNVLLASQPVILEQLNIGPCTRLWTTDYLNKRIGAERLVIVHDSATAKMDFQAKNFRYQTIPFGDLLTGAQAGRHMYLRALSSDRPSETATDLAKDFPAIARDFTLPTELAYVEEHAHSSPLRISGPVNMWLHYDVMANVLCQIKGSKRLLLYAPADVVHLGIGPGASSSSMNPFEPSSVDQKNLSRVIAHEAVLNEGDVLFIPPLWLHTAKPLSNLSIAVNVFFKDERMEKAYAAGKDVYGNRDIAAYERGRRDVQKIIKGFDGLSEQVRSFYLLRLAEELKASI